MPLAAPEEMPDAFARAWMGRDARALAALFAEDAEFVNVVGLWWHDRGAIERAHHIGLTTSFAQSTLTPGAIRTRPLGPDAAIVQARFTLTGQTAPDGALAGPRKTVLSFVMARAGEGWHCVMAQNTDVQPGAETYLNDGRALRPEDYRASRSS
ncbi:SgcJ/EcaC family oxidoreductase [Poseidonocella sedimentorum]|uniref:DUF4440 domain-containing protein n=1 Tax=Poseidonocella sedimentorum TaxID=871652 RepID=A0A1I6EEM8_9RHOB|nr:SgcJ/EcaC family oxidoreductase [Poseidonocella sedimentorum]SFR16216.1 conserved hypothetical protein [Poseidonocella sedimentorum]